MRQDLSVSAAGGRRPLWGVGMAALALAIAAAVGVALVLRFVET